MIHARKDYQCIQDTTGGTNIASDEPVFLLRAKDSIAPDIVRIWAFKLRDMDGDMDTVNKVLDHADKMAKWQVENERKLPDTPKDQLVD